MLNPPDGTFLYQIALFLVLWVALKKLWFDPALHVMRERSKRSEGALAEAARVEAEVARLREEQAAALQQARVEAQRDVQDVLRAADVEQRRIVDEAQAAAQRTLDDAREKIAGDVATARTELMGQVDAIARQVAATVLGRPV